MMTCKCECCRIDKEITRDNFRRNSSDKFHTICRICEDKVKYEKHINIDGLLWCKICGEYLPEDAFNISPHKNKYRRGRDTRCKKCRTTQSRMSRNIKTGSAGINRIMQERFLAAKLRSSKKEIAFDISEEYLHELLLNQQGKCAITGIELTFDLGKGRKYTNVSIDRINSNLGYIKDNVQLVCMVINQMKSDLTLEELKYFCKKLIDYSDGTIT